jgi:hypothetical protein
MNKPPTRVAPAPGELSTRSPETERSYLKRAAWFEAHTSRHLAIKNPTPLAVAMYALERQEEWAKSSWRQIKAALMFRFGQLGTPDALQAIDALRDASQTRCTTKTRRTSARRAKSVTPKAMERVLGAVRGSGSQYAPLLMTWLVLGVEVGLRPHEWTQATLIHATPLEMGDQDAIEEDPASAEKPQPYLRIENGKATNGRSHGKFRHMNLSQVKAGTLDLVSEFAEEMRSKADEGLYPKIYMGCTKLLQRINARIHARDSARWVQLYSPRHKFSSEAKRLLDVGGVAALMGHGTTKTATEHYGRRQQGTGSLGARPVASEVIRVRQVRHQAARRLAEKTPTPKTNPAT